MKMVYSVINPLTNLQLLRFVVIRGVFSFTQLSPGEGLVLLLHFVVIPGCFLSFASRPHPTLSLGEGFVLLLRFVAGLSYPTKGETKIVIFQGITFHFCTVHCQLGIVNC